MTTHPDSQEHDSVIRQQRDILRHALEQLHAILDFSEPVPGEAEVNAAWQEAFKALAITDADELLHDTSEHSMRKAA